MDYLSYMPGSSGILFSSFFVYLLAENSWHFLFYFSVLVIIIDIIFQSVVCKAKLIMIVFRFEYVLRNLGSCSIKKWTQRKKRFNQFFNIMVNFYYLPWDSIPAAILFHGERKISSLIGLTKCSSEQNKNQQFLSVFYSKVMA